jgi:nucleotide-binding universal stress UspA family protein
MLSIKRILVPVDFSEPSQRAVEYGLSLALQFKAKLVLTHIVSSSTALIYTFPTESFAFEKEQAKYAKSMLPDLVPEEYRERADLRTIVKVGEVRSELLGIVKDEEIDLVVMGTHGRKAFERFFLGSLTERMLRKLNVPILTVSHLDPARELHKAGPVPLGHVLYATDLSDNANVGMNFAMDLARGAGARLTVLHVLEALQTIYWGTEGGYLGNEFESIREDALSRLRMSIPGKGCEGLRLNTMITEGDAYREIIRVSDKEKADIIVMNLQGKTLAERALLGSTAERVIRSAHVPVLSIPIPAEVATGAAEKEAIVA